MDKDFDELLGEAFDFYGVDGNCFKLDDAVYEAVEDDDAINEIERCAHGSHAFHVIPIARIVIEQAAFGDELYELIDLHNGHCWLRVGVEVVDDGECVDRLFLFDYTPRNEVPLD